MTTPADPTVRTSDDHPELARVRLELEARERQEERIARFASVLLLIAGALVSHALGAPDAVVYNLTGGALTYLMPAPGSVPRAIQRVPLALLVGTAGAGLAYQLGG